MNQDGISQADLASFDLGLPKAVTPLIKRVLRLSEIERVYARVRACPKGDPSVACFCARTLEELGVSYSFPSEKIAALRELQGPLVFVANHPFGGVDALALMALMGEVRGDFRFMGNSILKSIPELAPALVPVDIMSNAALPPANVGILRGLHRHLSSGGTLGVFPAGEVSAFDSWRASSPVERPWHPHVARIVMKSRATVVPVFFGGRNSLLFQYLGLVAPSARIALLARELLRASSPLEIRIGAPIPFEESEAFVDVDGLTRYFRERTFGISQGSLL